MRNFSAFLLLIAIVATILPPGYAAYVGSYAAILVSLLALAVLGWRHWDVLSTPSALAIYGALTLVLMTLPFVYQSSRDWLAPALLLPMLSAVALATLGRSASFVPAGTAFAAICLVATIIAFAGGAYEHYLLGVPRPGLGNNAIHYASLAVMAGGMALVGVVASAAPWRYVFLLGPVLGLGAATVSGSRGPTVAAVAMVATACPFFIRWLWRDRLFRIAVPSVLGLATIAVALLVGSGNQRTMKVFESAFNIFRWTGGIDDIRASLYASALKGLAESPVFGHGAGQLMLFAREMYPDQAIMYQLGDLHADWANFAVMAGAMGLLAYFLLLSAPLLLLLDSRARQNRLVVFGGPLLVAGQLTLGVSNATFGILPQTMMYAVVLGYLMVQAGRAPATAEPV